MKTINFLTSHFIPENTACTNRVLAFVDELEKDYKVNVICLTEKGKSQKENKTTYSKNTDIYYINQKVSSDKNFVLRAYYEIIHISKLVKISNTLPNDLLIATTPYMFMIPIVGFGIKGKKILDIRDLVWEYIAEKSFVKKIIKKIFRIIMKSGIKKFDQIIVTNDREKKLLEEKYIARKIDIIPNGISLERYEKLSKIENKLNTHPFTVTYLGNIGFAHNLKLLVSVAKELPDINFVIIGDGMELQDIKTYASKNEISNVHFTGKLDWDEIKPYYEESSVLYAQLQKRLPSAMPSKLFEYASTGLPIIYGGTGHAVSFVNKLEQSMVIEPDDFSALKNAIEEMQDKTLKISEQNRILVKDNYLREATSKKLSQIVSQYIDQKSKG
jgi:glycosyltransferase involved in cell wall biosynthesis